MPVYKPPAPWSAAAAPVAFLAGSIEMGSATDWESFAASVLRALGAVGPASRP